MYTLTIENAVFNPDDMLIKTTSETLTFLHLTELMQYVLENPEVRQTLDDLDDLETATYVDDDGNEVHTNAHIRRADGNNKTADTLCIMYTDLL